MCGFFGIFDPNSPIPPGERLHASLSHRGPDSSQEHAEGGLYLKHYRLAILGGAAGIQPKESPCGRWMFAFNGEIYNFVELARELGQPGLTRGGDTEVLAALFSRFGVSAFERLNGMFAICLFDRREKRIYLARDRFGVKPLFYRQQGDRLVFASEIKAIQGELRPSTAAVSAYFDRGAYPAPPATFFADVWQVEPSTFLEFSGGKPATHRYYDFASRVAAREASPPGQEELNALIRDAVSIRLRSDRQVTLHLSSGVDSTSMLLHALDTWNKDYPLQCYSMRFGEERYDEAAAAEALCRELGVAHASSLLDAAEVPALAERLQGYQDEPYGGVPTIAYYKLNLLEQSLGAVVTLEGQGGDEIFCGYRTHVYAALLDLVERGEGDSETASRIVNYLGETREQALARAQSLAQAGFTSHTDGTDLRTAGPAGSGKTSTTWLKTIAFRNILESKLPRTLRFNDRASAATSREIRCPLLDYRVMEAGLALPLDRQFGLGRPKSPLLASISNPVWKRYLQVGKKAVVTPQTDWLKGPLKDWALAQIAELRQASLLDERYFSSVDSLFSAARPENSFPVWQLVNLNLWRRICLRGAESR